MICKPCADAADGKVSVPLGCGRCGRTDVSTHDNGRLYPHRVEKPYEEGGHPRCDGSGSYPVPTHRDCKGCDCQHGTPKGQ